MIVSFELLLWCLLSGAVYLLIIGFLWYKLEKVVPTLVGFPAALLEERGLGWFVSSYIIEFIFFVLLPSVVYGWLYTLIPFSGLRGGIMVGLYLLLFGMMPMALLILFRIKIPVVFMLYQLLGFLIKVMGSMAIIGYLYSL
ncbi:MAG: hypothetical protein NT002_07235 [candidate division Zixibacteria bacterium]|nr:hypothetical protein [candidate division Zixibacteria bacterium]